jgi:DNA primase large subunit
MEIVRSHRHLAAAAGGGGGDAGGLPTYRAAPQLEMRLEEFELFAIDRLRGSISWKFTPSLSNLGEFPSS